MPLPLSEALVEELIRADRWNEFAKVLGPNGVNALTDGPTSVLWSAVACKNHVFVEKMLQLGADPNVETNGSLPLRSAAAAGETKMVGTLLKHGADPTYGEAGYSSMIAARDAGHTHLFSMLRRHAAPFLAKKKTKSIVVKRRKKMINVSQDRGAAGLRQAYSDEQRWELLVVEASVEDVAKCFKELVHLNAHKTKVPEQKDQLFIVRLKNMPWTLCVHRLGAYSKDGRAWLHSTAQRMSGTLGEVLTYWGLQMAAFDGGRLVEERSWFIEDVNNPRFEDDEALMDRTELALHKQMDEWLTNKDLLLPSMEVVSDGFLAKLMIRGIGVTDVESMAVVDLEVYAN